MSKHNPRQQSRPMPPIPPPPATVRPDPIKPLDHGQPVKLVPTLKELQTAILSILGVPEYRQASCRQVNVAVPRATHLVLDAETSQPLTEGGFDLILTKREFISKSGQIHYRWCYSGAIDCSDLILPNDVQRMIARDLTGL